MRHVLIGLLLLACITLGSATSPKAASANHLCSQNTPKYCGKVCYHYEWVNFYGAGGYYLGGQWYCTYWGPPIFWNA